MRESTNPEPVGNDVIPSTASRPVTNSKFVTNVSESPRPGQSNTVVPRELFIKDSVRPSAAEKRSNRKGKNSNKTSATSDPVTVTTSIQRGFFSNDVCGRKLSPADDGKGATGGLGFATALSHYENTSSEEGMDVAIDDIDPLIPPTQVESRVSNEAAALKSAPPLPIPPAAGGRGPRRLESLQSVPPLPTPPAAGGRGPPGLESRLVESMDSGDLVLNDPMVNGPSETEGRPIGSVGNQYIPEAQLQNEPDSWKLVPAGKRKCKAGSPLSASAIPLGNRFSPLTAEKNPRQNTDGVPLRPLPLFQAVFENEDMANKFLNIRYICGFKVRIEKFKPPKGPPQCHCCQQFGHVDKACNMNARCVKCGLNHLSKDCIKPREEAAKCANCSGSHPASYRGCPTYQRLKEKIKILKEKARLKFNPNIRPEQAAPVIDLDNEDFPALNPRGENLATPKNHTYAQIAANAEVDPVSAEINRMKKNLNIRDEIEQVPISRTLAASRPAPAPLAPSKADWRLQFQHWILKLMTFMSQENITKESFVEYVLDSTRSFIDD
ncbi:hypothetical protein J437_LFUL016168 [Ladona fulva]|uniref:Gag-like protein n=1 Tax=Ladona fulva TaxID=123851 RepID=A0A8K0P805_LADFU|nr:hypothetical protein J437_LFUL016168 [Ladona fulva]